jgi:hypothetical protein
MVNWKPVVGYEGLYEVSDQGHVRGVKFGHRNRKISTCSQGYQRVGLSKHGKNNKHRVHILVAKAFVSGYSPGKIVNHIDGVKHNNHAQNLEWCTHSQNAIHAFENGLSRKGVDHRWTKTWVVTSPEGVTAKLGGLRELCQVFGLDPSCMTKVSKGKITSHKGWGCVRAVK